MNGLRRVFIEIIWKVVDIRSVRVLKKVEFQTLNWKSAAKYSIKIWTQKSAIHKNKCTIKKFFNQLFLTLQILSRKTMKSPSIRKIDDNVLYVWD